MKKKMIIIIINDINDTTSKGKLLKHIMYDIDFLFVNFWFYFLQNVCVILNSKCLYAIVDVFVDDCKYCIHRICLYTFYLFVYNRKCL